MNDSNRTLKLVAPALPWLVIAVVPLAAFLAFFLEPLVGKTLAPIYGGTSGTWLGCMVYFQLTLLLGYSWAAWLARKRIAFQVAATVILGIVAALTFRLPSDQDDAVASISRVVWRLAFTSLPAMVLLFSTTPLLHGWLRRRGEEVPYYLYAVSSIGGLLAVVLYPFVFEPGLGLGDQSFYWQGCLVVVAGILAAVGYIVERTTEGSPTQAVRRPAGLQSVGLTVFCLWLSALSCAGMLGATYHLSAEVGSVPIAWVGPFGAYLLSFMVTFSGRWRRWMTLTAIVWLAVSLTGFMVAKGFTAATVNYQTLWWLISLTASGSFLANALLYSVRPTERYEIFYLVLAAGGVLGGLFTGMILPHLFSQPIEFALASAALLTTGVLWLTGRRDPATVAVTACVLLVPVLGLGFQQSRQAALGDGQIRHLRNLYGHLMVKTDARSVVLSSDTTTQGSQLTFDAAARRHPTLYYTESSGVGRVLRQLQATRPQLTVGVVGLGAGTLAAYARPADVFDFWDVNPQSLQVARENFTFVADSPGHINLLVRDGRKAIEASRTDYDVLIIDGMTGAGVPAHLLTRDAMLIYQTRLAARNGLLVVTANTRYSKLFPVIQATARSVNRAALDVVTDISGSRDDQDWDPTHTEYVIVGQSGDLNTVKGWFSPEEDNGRVKHVLTTIDSPQLNRQLVWSDDRNAALDNLELGRFLFAP